MKVIRIYTLFSLLVLSAGTLLDAQYMDLLWERYAHYPFTSETGGLTNDLSVYENHGSVFGATQSEDHRGGAGYSYYFDGEDDHIDCGNGIPAFSTAVTVSCWIKSSVTTGSSHIVSKYDFASDGGFILATENGLVRWAVRDGSGQFIKMTSLSRIDDGQWHCLVGMVDGENWSLYVDGNLEGQIVTGHTVTDLSTTAPLTIGYYFKGDNGDHQYFQGMIDQVLIHGRALNECELGIIFTGEVYPPR